MPIPIASATEPIAISQSERLLGTSHFVFSQCSSGIGDHRSLGPNKDHSFPLHRNHVRSSSPNPLVSCTKCQNTQRNVTIAQNVPSNHHEANVATGSRKRGRCIHVVWCSSNPSYLPRKICHAMSKSGTSARIPPDNTCHTCT